MDTIDVLYKSIIFGSGAIICLMVLCILILDIKTYIVNKKDSKPENSSNDKLAIGCFTCVHYEISAVNYPCNDCDKYSNYTAGN